MSLKKKKEYIEELNLRSVEAQGILTFPAAFVNATTDDRIQSFVVINFCVAVGSSCSIVAF
jgi:hypothetical protein